VWKIGGAATLVRSDPLRWARGIYGLMAYSVARLFIKMVFSSCAWAGRQQRMSAMAIVNLCLVQFGSHLGDQKGT
jgi:hypothetical protein